jgi:GNAT superfamily N-acetyltransferase
MTETAMQPEACCGKCGFLEWLGRIRMTYQLVSLREQPQHLPTVAQWIHKQWWSTTDTPPEAIQRWLSSHLGQDGFPTTIVAITDGRPVGSVSLHETEAEDRPDFKPYLGALFVTPDSRGLGLGVALVQAIENLASSLGYPAIYLNAANALVPFYEALGWRVVERGYGPKQLNIMQR